MAECTVKFPINREVVSLLYFSKITGIPFDEIILLHKEMGRGLFFMFYMLEGKKISFPSLKKFCGILSSSDKVSRGLLSGFTPKDLSSRDRGVYDFFKKIQFAEDSKKILLRYGSDEGKDI